MNSDDHWRRLAAELGLDAGPEPEPTTVPDRENASYDEAGDVQTPTEADEPEPPLAAEELPARASRGRRRRSAAPREKAEPVAEAPALDPTEVEEPPPAGGRGRRGRQSPAAPPPEAEESAPAAEEGATPVLESEEADAATEEEAKPRRRRRRSRRKKSDKAEPAGASPEADEAAESADAEDETDSGPPAAADDETPEEVVTDWNVPSWDELIASLYRPAR
jgi:hypothetical protein